MGSTSQRSQPPVALDTPQPSTPEGSPQQRGAPQRQAFVPRVNSQSSQVSPSLAASGALVGVLEVAGVLDPLSSKTLSIQ